MKIIACIKQVPGTTKVEIDETTGVLKRGGVESKLNPYDLYTVEAAVGLAERSGGSVSALTMGPPQAEAVIREALSMGADEGVLLSDRAFAGADVLATAYALSQAVHTLGEYDLILCGKQTTDGDTAQVGPELAECLGIPSVSNVISILAVEKGFARVEADTGDCVYTLSVKLPCLLAVEKDCCMPRLPSYLRRRETAARAIRMLSLADLSDNDPSRYGLNGSPTQVERIFAPESSIERVEFSGTAEESAQALYELLADRKIIAG